MWLLNLTQHVMDYASSMWHQWQTIGMSTFLASILEIITKYKDKHNYIKYIYKLNKHHLLTFFLLFFALLLSNYFSYNEINSSDFYWRPFTNAISQRFSKAEKGLISEAGTPIDLSAFGRVGVFYKQGCSECREFALSLANTMKKDGWSISDPSWETSESRGIELLIKIGLDGTPLPSIQIISAAFQAAHIPFQISLKSASKEHIFEIIINSR